MVRIIGYHPEIVVGDAVIEVDLDDWYPEEEVVAKLLRAADAGDLVGVVWAIEVGEFNLGLPDGIAGVRVRK